jgi:methionine synthase / methylenetetrahydrofolate reductase(NADPH)
MRQAVPEARFSVMPNAGWPEQVGGRVMYPANPEYFGEYARAFCEAGARLIGGCCGTTPQHIAAMRAALESDSRPAVGTGAELLAWSNRRARPQPTAHPSGAEAGGRESLCLG